MQRSGWTRDVEYFLQWLLAVPFGGGGFNEVAIAEGLSEALMVNSTGENSNILFFLFMNFIWFSQKHVCR